MGTDDPAERDLIQGLIKLAAAYVHGVRGNPAGVARNLEGARDRLRERALGGAGVAGIELDVAALLAADRRAPGRPGRGRPDRARSPSPGGPDEPRLRDPDRSTSPRPSAGCARTRPADPRSTSASRTSSPRSGRPGPCSCRRRRSRPGPGSCRRTGRSWSSATRRAVRGGDRLPRPLRPHGRGQRGRRDGRLGAGRAAGPPRPARPGRGRAPGLTAGRAGSAAGGGAR